MARVAIVVEFNIKPGQHAAFDRLIREHARKTLDEEPGCQRFCFFQPGGNIDQALNDATASVNRATRKGWPRWPPSECSSWTRTPTA